MASMSRIGSIGLLACAGFACTAGAQELEPRAYSAAPVGANFLVLAYSRSDGGVLFDPSLPATDVTAKIESGALGYARTFGLAGRAASAAIALPYVDGDFSGNVGEQRQYVGRSGLADVRLRLAVNLLGGPALSPKEFAQRTPATTLGASLSVVAPTGEYDASKLINIGANRWAFKPEIGVSHPIGNWFVEGSAGVWLFTDNDEFNGNSRRQQDPLATFQLHAGYTFRPGLWLAGNATYYSGGRTSVDGAAKEDLQENSRYGVTLSVPIDRRWSTKFAWSNGFSTRIGGDFRTLSFAVQYLWFDR